MAYKTFVTMNIAIIGSGDTAETYASAFALAGHHVYMAWNEDEAGASDALQLLENVHVCSIEEAADLSDLVIIATAPKDVREVAYWLGDVRRKVIIDASANVCIAAGEEVRTACAITAITGSQHVIKAFNAKGYEQIMKPLFKGDKVELLLTGDSLKAKEVIKILCLEMGVTACYDLGGSDTIPLFDELTKCWRNLVVATNLVQPVTVI
jgi:predicted dinucleotide-binding enzyme